MLYIASPSCKITHRQTCRCGAYTFPHRLGGGKCALYEEQLASMRGEYDEERAAFKACEVRGLNYDNTDCYRSPE